MVQILCRSKVQPFYLSWPDKWDWSQANDQGAIFGKQSEWSRLSRPPQSHKVSFLRLFQNLVVGQVSNPTIKYEIAWLGVVSTVFLCKKTFSPIIWHHAMVLTSSQVSTAVLAAATLWLTCRLWRRSNGRKGRKSYSSIDATGIAKASRW